MTVQRDDVDMAFFDTLSETNKSAWITDLIINGKKVPFKLYTGAEVTAISKDTWKVLGEPSLQRSDKQLFGPVQQRLSWTSIVVTFPTSVNSHSAKPLWLIN